MCYNVTSFDLKLALIEYYRFKKMYVVADECISNWDIGAANENEIIEVEVKISIKDLLKEKYKKVGKNLKHEEKFLNSKKHKSNTLNHHMPYLKVVKRSTILHKKYNQKLFNVIALRSCCKMASLMHEKYKSMKGE